MKNLRIKAIMIKVVIRREMGKMVMENEEEYR